MTDVATWLADGISALALAVACGAAIWARAQAVEARRQREIAAQRHHLDRDPSPEFGQFSMTPSTSPPLPAHFASHSTPRGDLHVVVTVKQDCVAVPWLMSPMAQGIWEHFQREPPSPLMGLNIPHRSPQPRLLLQGIPTELLVVGDLPLDVNLDGLRLRLGLWPPGTSSGALSWRCGCGRPEHPPKPHWERSIPVKPPGSPQWPQKHG